MDISKSSYLSSSNFGTGNLIRTDITLKPSYLDQSDLNSDDAANLKGA